MKHTISFHEAKRLLEEADCVVLQSGNLPFVVTRFVFFPQAQLFCVHTTDSVAPSLQFDGRKATEVITVDGNEMRHTGSAVRLFLYQNKVPSPTKDTQ